MSKEELMLTPGFPALAEAVLRHYPAAQAVYLFGSFGTEWEREESDIDLAVLLPATESLPQADMAVFEVQCELEAELGRPVDLHHLRKAKTVMQKEIVKDGRLIHIGDRDAVLEFEALTLSLYQKLNEERREILAAFEKTGRAYSV